MSWFKRRPLTMKQRKKKLEKLRAEARILEQEAKVTRQVRAEREEIDRLMTELHPSKVKRLAKLLGKTEHGAIEAGRAFARAHKKIHEGNVKLQKFKEKLPQGWIVYKESKKKK